jgi:hypothetical protein
LVAPERAADPAYWGRDTNRYRLLETIRTFGRRRLEDAGEAEFAAGRDLRWRAAFTASVGMPWARPNKRRSTP